MFVFNSKLKKYSGTKSTMNKKFINIQPILKRDRVKVKIMENIDPLFVTLYVENVCKSIHEYSEFNRCISNLTVPSLEEQYKIIEILRQTNKIVDISDILGPSMNLLIHQQYDKFEELVNALINYNIALETMRELIKSNMPIFADVFQV